ncbi:hypothetical protein LTR16_010687, partial [Cryomyces antarcticus]
MHWTLVPLAVRELKARDKLKNLQLQCRRLAFLPKPSLSSNIASPPTDRFKLIFSIPPSSLAAAKTAVFATGAGSYPGPGHYTEVCFTVSGTSQFRPGEGAKPNIGTVGQLEELEGVRCEILCVGRDIAWKVVDALK